jgi:hypothetical protein
MGWEHSLFGRVSLPISRTTVHTYWLYSRFAQYIYGVYLGLNGEFVCSLRIRELIICFRSFTFPHTDRASSRTSSAFVCRIYSISTRLQCRSMGA